MISARVQSRTCRYSHAPLLMVSPARFLLLPVPFPQ